jgi:hypothetical protein
MSGRTRVVLADGRTVRGYRKTLRKNSCEPLVGTGNAPPVAAGLPPDPPSTEYPVRLNFLLPNTILVSPGPHGFNTAVLPGNMVRIRGRETRHCFFLAREFFAVVAHDRPAFTCRAVVTHDHDPRTYGRHLTVVRGALVISGGPPPRVYDCP